MLATWTAVFNACSIPNSLPNILLLINIKAILIWKMCLEVRANLHMPMLNVYRICGVVNNVTILLNLNKLSVK